ncbi:unnamed protein product [Chrysoparadoxa australica]
MFLFINNVVPTTNALISTIYEQHQDPDGFLYLKYASESTFG